LGSVEYPVNVRRDRCPRKDRRARGGLTSARCHAWMAVRSAFSVGARSLRGPIGRPGETDAHAVVLARGPGVGVRLKGPGGPRRVVAWRPVQTVLGSREDSARARTFRSPLPTLKSQTIQSPQSLPALRCFAPDKMLFPQHRNFT